MRMNFPPVLEIEDLGDHPAATVLRLGILLAGPLEVTPDPKRKDFYEVECGSIVYYIYVSPVSGLISLLACWENVIEPMLSSSQARLAHSVNCP